ncbi:MAG TPA: DUF2249 domain-containing protein [Allocoleopsis sp.]
MLINANTKIAYLLKKNPGTLEAIIGLSPRFNKLRNPLLRKLMAGRTSIAMASRIGGCSVEDFFRILEPLGFIIDRGTKVKDEVITHQAPEFMRGLRPDEMMELDVRPIIESGKDPLDQILIKVKSLNEGQVLRITNSFEPTPLMILLGKKGFESWAEHKDADLVHTYFYKKPGVVESQDLKVEKGAEGWNEILLRFKGNLVEIDVRELEMPLPMHRILEALDTLPTGKALFVHHKRVPVFLLPELADRKLSYRVNEIGEGQVELLIFKE